MDDTDGPKHCGEEKAHMPHEYTVHLREAISPGAKESDAVRLWSCDGMPLPAPGSKLPDDISVMEQSAKYQQATFPVSLSNGGFRSQRVTLDVCNLCGAVVGNRPAHDVFCYSDDGPAPENYR